MTSVLADGFNVKTLLRGAVVFSGIFLRDEVKFGNYLDADNTSERIVRCEKQSAPFSRTQVDKREVGVVDWDRGQHLVELIRFDWLIRFTGKEFANPSAKTDVGPRCIDVMVEIELKIAESRSPASRSRVTQKLPQADDQSGECAKKTAVPNRVLEPPTGGAGQTKRGN